jgi:hypothetical protein
VRKYVGLLKREDFRYGGFMDADKTKIGAGQDFDGDGAGAAGVEPAAGRQVTEADRRRERAAAKLRENLARRKQQVRARRAGQADETDGLPAAKTDES